MRTPAAEKLIRNLPCVRVSEPLEIELMRLAAAQHRSLSDYVRLVLELHVFGHAASVDALTARDQDGRA